MRAQQNENRCKSRTKAGKPCHAAAMEGGLCFFHANPTKAAELGRIGGRRNRHIFMGLADPAKDLKTAKGVLEECARLIENVYTGKIPPKIASCVAPLLNLQMRVIQVAELEARIARLEQARAGANEHPNDSIEESG
jgi:hypothetical protein